MSIYPIIKNKRKSNILHSSNSWYSKSYAEKFLSMYLEDVISEDEKGKAHKYFRLCASQPHSMEMALRYDIHCPCCKNMLKPKARMLNAHELFLYKCPLCSKE